MLSAILGGIVGVGIYMLVRDYRGAGLWLRFAALLLAWCFFYGLILALFIH